MTEIFLASLILGGIAGIAAGLFGIGGGALIVPVLSWLFAAYRFDAETIMLLAVATSLATALFTSTASVRAHHRLGNIDWHLVLRLSPGLLLGAAAGAALATFISAAWLRGCFIAYLLYTGLKMLRPSTATADKLPAQSRFGDYLAGPLIGLLSAILGIGGGTMTVPYLARSGLAMKNAVAVSSACALSIALSGALSYALLGQHSENLPDGSLGYIYLPAFAGIVSTSIFTAPLGAKLAHNLPGRQLKRYFGGLLLLIALKMLWQSQGT